MQTGARRSTFLGFQPPAVGEEEVEAVAETIRSGWLTTGPKAAELEERAAEALEAKHVLAVASGTAALHLALLAVGVVPGAEVITVSHSFIASVNVIRQCGATPVFVDIDPKTYNLDPNCVRDAVTLRTRAIIPVHLYGSMADLDALLPLAERHRLAVVEDCAHAQGSKWRRRGAGSWGHVGSFSFHQSKSMSSGEGGICLTNDAALADRLFRLKQIGYSRDAAQGQARTGPPAGLQCHNYRGTEFAAVILQEQLRQLDERMARFQSNAEFLRQRLAELGIKSQSKGRHADPQGYYGFIIRFDEGPLAEVPIDLLRRAFLAEGLTLSPTYGPVPQHILFNMRPDEHRVHGDCPVAFGPIVQRALLFFHTILGADPAEIRTIGNIFEKVASASDDLRQAAS